MDGKMEDLTTTETNWRIPRPALTTRPLHDKSIDTSSNHSTRSARSNELLLSAANLHYLHTHYTDVWQQSKQVKIDLNDERDPFESVSMVSSTHFTDVNGAKRRTETFCWKHRLTVLVTSMCLVFMFGIMAGVMWMDARARKYPQI